MCSQGENLDLAITKDEVVVLIGEGVCAVKTLTKNHLYCEPPPQQPAPLSNGKKREGSDNLPEFTVSAQRLSPKSLQTRAGPLLNKDARVFLCFRSEWET